MRRFFPLLSLLVSPLLSSSAACSSGPPPIAMTAYCAREATALCTLAMRCGCTFDITACEATHQASCDRVLGATDISMAVAAGTLRWDGDAAAMLLAKTEATPMLCGSVNDVLDATLASGAFDGALVGTLAVGSPCVTLSDPSIEACAAGSCVAHQCARLVDLGATCDTTTLCGDLSRPLSLVSTRQPSALCSHGMCVRQNAPPGESCTSGAECASSTCTMLHCQGLPTGLACIDDFACDSLTCTGSHCVDAPTTTGPAICTALAP